MVASLLLRRMSSLLLPLLLIEFSNSSRMRQRPVRWKENIPILLNMVREQCPAAFEILDSGDPRDLAKLLSLDYQPHSQAGGWYMIIITDEEDPDYFKLYIGKSIHSFHISLSPAFQ